MTPASYGHRIADIQEWRCEYKQTYLDNPTSAHNRCLLFLAFRNETLGLWGARAFSPQASSQARSLCGAPFVGAQATCTEGGTLGGFWGVGNGQP